MELCTVASKEPYKVQELTFNERYNNQVRCHMCGKSFEGDTITKHKVPTEVFEYRKKLNG